MKLLLILLSLSSLLYGGERGWNSPELAKAYFQHSEFQRRWAWQLLGEYSFKGSEQILDFGCGDEKITAEISRLIPVASIVGVDLSYDMIYLANTHFSKIDLKSK